MKKDNRARKKLSLSKQTVRTLSDQYLAHIAGAGTNNCDPTAGTLVGCAATDLC